jgi:hypothetical protein
VKATCLEHAVISDGKENHDEHRAHREKSLAAAPRGGRLAGDNPESHCAILRLLAEHQHGKHHNGNEHEYGGNQSIDYFLSVPLHVKLM